MTKKEFIDKAEQLGISTRKQAQRFINGKEEPTIDDLIRLKDWARPKTEKEIARWRTDQSRYRYKRDENMKLVLNPDYLKRVI